MNRCHLRSGLSGQLLGKLGLGNVHVGQVGHLGDVSGGQRQPVKLALQQQGTEVLQATLHLWQLLAVQAVTNFEVVVQKAQRRAHGKGVQPQRGFGQLHRHGVFIDAEDGFLQNHAAHDVAVIELRIRHGPAVVFGGGFNAAANMRHARQHRALPRTAAFDQVRGPRLFADKMGGGGNGLQHPVSQIINQRHQKMAAPHGRVANFELENLAGGVFGVQCVPVAGVD